jgi:hypothetical protein
MEESELKFESIEPDKVPEGVYEEDGALYDADGNPVPADKFVPSMPTMEIPKAKFQNMFTKDAKLPSGRVTIDENGFEVNSKLNVDRAPLNDSTRNTLAEIMGSEFVNAFSSGKTTDSKNKINIINVSKQPVSVGQTMNLPPTIPGNSNN